jgi:hypothetical protein
VYGKTYGRLFDERSIRTAFEDFFYERVGAGDGGMSWELFFFTHIND